MYICGYIMDYDDVELIIRNNKKIGKRQRERLRNKVLKQQKLDEKKNLKNKLSIKYTKEELNMDNVEYIIQNNKKIGKRQRLRLRNYVLKKEKISDILTLLCKTLNCCIKYFYYKMNYINKNIGYDNLHTFFVNNEKIYESKLNKGTISFRRCHYINKTFIKDTSATNSYDIMYYSYLDKFGNIMIILYMYKNPYYHYGSSFSSITTMNNNVVRNFCSNKYIQEIIKNQSDVSINAYSNTHMQIHNEKLIYDVFHYPKCEKYIFDYPTIKYIYNDRIFFSIIKKMWKNEIKYMFMLKIFKKFKIIYNILNIMNLICEYFVK